MKQGAMKSFLAAAVAVSVAFVLLGSKKAEEVKEKAKETVKAAVELTAEQKAEVEAKLKAQMAEIQEEIAELKKKGTSGSAQVKEEATETLHRLELSYDKLRADYRELQSATGSAWDRLREGLSAASDDLKKALKKAKAEYTHK